jgi:hypothetical protein
VANKQFDMGDYKEVAERIQDFRAMFPEGTLQSEVIPSPVDGFVLVKGYAYRHPDDARPGIGLAWEPVPGKTPYTRDSEIMNAETSAWGRAIIAVGASDAKRVASANEVRNRQAPDHGLLQLQIETLLEKADGLVDPVKVREYASKGVAEAEASIVKLNGLLAKAG